MTKPEGVDPRFDPRYQRGFDVERDQDAAAAARRSAPIAPSQAPFRRPGPSGAAAPSPPTPPVPSTPPVVPRVEAAAPLRTPSVRAPSSRTSSNPNEPAAEAAPPDPDDDGVRFAVDDVPPLPPRRNPFDTALLLVGIVLLAAAPVTLWAAAQPGADRLVSTDAGAYFVQLLVSEAPGACVFAGGLALVLWLAVQALRR